ncbi:hypothetical protein [Microbacterium aurantiacum]|uniref:Uncharacterized protein n=1 Tax=Microbacterium aurantiacum TaxID=162393 RepID=A0ABT8FRG4_9MICO|nr:hypothetical protein [Microbacterium aurantiacum]MDN4463907.1 hypothetical protein [Microbacterium aurantiacum]
MTPGDVIGWILAVVLGVPAALFGLFAWREAKRASALSTRQLRLAETADTREEQRDARVRREARAEFAHRLRELEQLTTSIGREPTPEQYEQVFSEHIAMHGRALALNEPGAVQLVEYAAMVHSGFTRRLRNTMRQESPRDRATGWTKGRWEKYGELERSWIDDPDAATQRILDQGYALIAAMEAGSVRNEKQWHDRWPWR